MRILILCSSARITGGAEKVALTSALGLAKRGHQVRVVAARGQVGAEFLNVPNLEIQVLNPEPLREGRDLAERAKMIWPEGVSKALKPEFEWARADKGTVVHFHCGYLELGIPGFRALAHCAAPIVYTHHDYAWACPLMGFYDYTRKSSCGLEGGSLSCLATDCAERYLEKLVRYSRHLGTHQTSGIGRNVSHHVFVSEMSKAKLLPYLAAEKPNNVLYNGSESIQAPRQITEETAELVFLGRLTAEKDPLTFAQTAARVQMGAKIIGEGPLEQQLRESGFGDSLVGWKSGGDVTSILSQGRALVVTSRCMETASLVVQEAAAVGLPAIVPADTAAAEFVHHECTGLIYDRHQPDSLEQSMSRLKDSNFANFLGEEAYRQYWDSPPTWDRHLDGLEEIYRQVLAA